MDNKELPQEVVKEISVRSEKNTDNMGPISREILVSDRRSGYTIGAKIAQSHYEPIIQAKESEATQYLKDVQLLKQSVSAKIKKLTAKDTTIKEQAEKIEKLTGLLEMYFKEAIAARYHDSKAALDEQWEYLKEQHGI